jgi:hypothetical protein
MFYIPLRRLGGAQAAVLYTGREDEDPGSEIRRMRNRRRFRGDFYGGEGRMGLGGGRGQAVVINVTFLSECQVYMACI